MLHILYLYCIYVCGYIGGMAISLCMYVCMYVCMYEVEIISIKYSVAIKQFYPRKVDAFLQVFGFGAVLTEVRVAIHIHTLSKQFILSA